MGGLMPAEPAVAPLTVLVNGIPVSSEARGTLFFRPESPGFTRVTVIDSSGAADSVVVQVEDSASPVAAPLLLSRQP